MSIQVYEYTGITSAGLYRAEQIDQRQGILLAHNDETADAPLAPS